MVAMDGRRRSPILFLDYTCFCTYIVKHVIDIETLFLEGKWEKFVILSLIYESMEHRNRSLWSQERMHGFVDHSLFGS